MHDICFTKLDKSYFVQKHLACSNIKTKNWASLNASAEMASHLITYVITFMCWHIFNLKLLAD